MMKEVMIIAVVVLGIGAWIALAKDFVKELNKMSQDIHKCSYRGTKPNTNKDQSKRLRNK